MVVVTETRLEYQKLNIIRNFERERAWPSLLRYNIRVSFNFLVKESKIKLSGCLFFQNTLKKTESNVTLVRSLPPFRI